MKRSSAIAVAIGATVSVLVLALHISGALLKAEFGLSEAFSTGTAVGALSEPWQWLLVAVLATGMAWVTLESVPRWRAWLIGAAIVVELATAAWVCGLHKFFFQPLPGMLATLLSFAAGAYFTATARGRRARMVHALFAGRLAQERIDAFVAADAKIPTVATPRDVSVVVCDIAGKNELVDEMEPAKYAALVHDFGRWVSKLLIDLGAYIQSADGEGVVAVFGFPLENASHAIDAARAALRVTKSFVPRADDLESESQLNCGVHVGVSSGLMVVAPDAAGQLELLAAGEALEVARRLCVANRAYGSHVLIGPRTLQLAGDEIVARPLDFLYGADARERVEVYELTALAADASPEEIARRDSFWRGVVYYRERKWGEAYAEFQKASANGSEDAPVQLYLRRLEPLLIGISDTPSRDLLI